MNNRMEAPPISRKDRWRNRFHQARKFIRKTFPFASGVLAALLGVLLYNLLVPAPRPLTLRDVTTAVGNVLASATPAPPFSEGVYQAIQPSLVLIQSKISNSSGADSSKLGSGVIINDNGEVLTSLHVVADAAEIQLTFADGTQSSAKVTAQQPEKDIAVLHPDTLPKVIVPATLGNPHSMQVGDEAYVVGNPFGLYSSMSAGVISGFDRTFQPTGTNQKFTGLIQIDAAVNPGNSGGPLLNRYGQVIGIIEGIVSPGDQEFFIGIGFAVPIDVAGQAVGSPID